MSPTALDEPAAAVRPKGMRARIGALPRRTLLINIGLALLVILVLVLAFISLGPRQSSDAGVRTVAVTRGTVTAKVTGTGNATSSASTPVSFPTPGVLTAVDVQPGDKVTRGQILATIDDAAARENLRTAQAQLANSRAALAQSAAGPTDVKAQQDQLAITQAQQGVGNANATLAAAQRQRELDDQSTATAIANAKTQLANDQKAQDNAVNAAQLSETTACAATSTAATSGDTSTSGAATPTATSSCDTAKQATQTARDNRDAALAKDQQAITTAEQSRAATLAKDDAAIQTDRQQVTTAQGQVTSAQLTRQAGLHPQTPAQIAQARASVDSAQVQVDTAQRTVDETRLLAPQDGVVLSVGGKVGETASSSGGAATATTGTGTTGSASGGASTAAATSAGSGFIVIANLSKLAVTADIAEADAAKVQLGQAATVTFPATGTTATGSVTQITPQSTVTNNVVLYPITVSLDTAPTGVVVGATADLSITTGAATNVLQVPTAAITTVGSRHAVTIRRDGAESMVSVQTGVSGDTVTEITGGLAEGEQLVLPSGVATVTGGFPGAGRQNGGGQNGGGQNGGARTAAGRTAAGVRRPVIELRDVTKIYGTEDDMDTVVHAVDGINLVVDRGEHVAVMGASGSGKSTLMNIIGCLDGPTTGRYLLDGVDVRRLDEQQQAVIRNRKIGFIFQSFNLIPRTTALSNVELPLAYAGVRPAERRRRALAALDQVGLGDRAGHRPSQLSGGQQQRVAIARAIATDPVLLLADEPTGALDSHSTEEVLTLFDGLNAAGRTVVVITHEADVAARAGRVLRMRDGRILSDEKTSRHGRAGGSLAGPPIGTGGSLAGPPISAGAGA